ncbi:hypothetical protein [Lishizhenia sp.]|uniref:hypothetical protein n=1 Tax=Lishizhenia sp. TaxID=2497594 RepID=UPI00299D4155|nr:hypothetical protein [Lishizhenia sp.]MDX1444615.1 hypothetical protein [Lishizhenia sp.]
MKRIFTLLAILTLFTAAAQKVDYDYNSRWYFGLNAGATWQTTDVNTKLRLGSGFVFGKSFNMDRGRLLSFDLGVRYLYGYWEGVDDFQTTNISANAPVYNVYNNLGAFQQNFLSEQHAGDIELALHFNRLRERTGWDPYLFGAIGFTAHQSYGDIYTYDGDFNQVPYDFAAGEQLEGVYRTPLEANSGTLTYNNFVWRTTPSLGFGIGYYFAPRISFGFEHRTTFTLTDYYDGTVVDESGFADNYNDLYHYSNLYLKWYIKDRHREEDDYVQEEPQPEPEELVEDVNKVYLPIVDFTQPSSTPTKVANPNYTLKAKVQYVAGKDNVQFSQNGQNSRTFTYNANTDVFTANVTLIPGQNTFTLQGTNEEGADQETIIINYEREVKTPPVVEITRPNNTPHTVYKNVYSLNANVLNVTSKQNITFTFNNQVLNNFNFNTQNGVLSANLNLISGTNTVHIAATNEDGSASDETLLIYKREVSIQQPDVQFTNPSISPYTHNANTFNLVANVLNVTDINNIIFKVNGSQNQNFSFNANTGIFTANVVLMGGQNVFEIIGSNSAGTDQDIVFINYREPAPTPPVVAITNPQNPTYVTNNSNHTVVANILNISSANQITMTVNGSTTQNFSYNNNNNTLTANVNLVEGNNIVTISATNGDGTDSKQCTIVYRKPVTVQAPTVEFTQPNYSPFTTNTQQQYITAAVYNVSSANAINVSVNGSNFNNFTYNANTHQVNFNVNLIEGANIITISATNSAGSDNDSQTIIYRKPVTQAAPIVNIVDPVQSPLTVYNNNYLVQATVQHVNGSQDITVKINGIATQNFSYVASNNQVSVNAGLNEGANTIQILASNNAGQDSESTTIIYKRQQVATPPVVHITQPATNVTVGTSNYQITALVQNINNENDIDLVINGNGINNFTYNANTLELTYTLNFNNAGIYTVQIVASNAAGTASDNVNINYQPEEDQKLPEVYYLQPSSNITVNTPNYALKAKVLHVDTKSQIVLKHNGQTVNQSLYSFNTANKEVVFNHSLVPGNNMYKIIATNSAGSAEEDIAIVYRKVVVKCDEPIIRLVAPATTAIRTDQNSFNVQMNIAHVGAANQIQLKVNGKPKNFSFVNGVLKTKIYLTEGSNSVQIIAANECGQTKEAVTITYKAPQKPCDKPTITSRQASTIKTKNSTTAFIAQVNGVKASNMIKVMVNGKNHPFTYDPASKQLRIAINPLQMGNNTIKIMANNECGGIDVNYSIVREDCEKPVLNLRSSQNDRQKTIADDMITISGNISDVKNRADVEVIFNGRATTFNFSPNNGAFSFRQNLKIGKNLIIVKAKNECGSAQKSFSFNYMPQPVVAKPTLTLVYPKTTKFATEQANHTVKVKASNVTAASDIQVKINGVNTRFKFHVPSQMISFNTTLKAGINKIVVSAVNVSGSATLNLEMNYKEKPQEAKPVITITNPDATPAILSKEGRVLFQANVTNITKASQVKVYMNGKLYSNYQAELNNGVLTINATVSMTTSNANVNLQIIATNTGGSSSATQVITLQQSKTIELNGGEGTTRPTNIQRRR